MDPPSTTVLRQDIKQSFCRERGKSRDLSKYASNIGDETEAVRKALAAQTDHNVFSP